MTTRRCALCAVEGHNMTTCDQLPFRQDQAHRLYAHMWQKWVETYPLAALDGYPIEYFQRANEIEVENTRWLNNPIIFRVLKSYLNLNALGTDLTPFA